jgi:hypothetical protein
MKRLLFALMLVALSLAVVAPAFAMEACDPAMDEDHMTPTIDALIAHVDHAYAMGHIDTAGNEAQYLAALNAAKTASANAQPLQAIQAIGAFELLVKAQSGKHIDPTCAEHLIMQAEHVKMALQGQM